MKTTLSILIILLALVPIVGFSQLPETTITQDYHQFQILGGANPNKPALKISSRRLYYPPGTAGPASIPGANILEFDGAYNVVPAGQTYGIPTPVPRRRLLTFSHQGYLGIGTDKPNALLQLNKTRKGQSQLQFSFSPDTTKTWDLSTMGTEGSANTYWANNVRMSGDKWMVDRGSFNGKAFRLMHSWDAFHFQFYEHDDVVPNAPTHQWRPFKTDWQNAMKIKYDGDVKIYQKLLIGDAAMPGNYRLYVEDGILTERIKVALKSTSQWADHVFDEDYELLPLDKVKSFISENRHLPGIPSADEVVENGVDVVDMEARLLLKIEELTLHVISLNEQIQKMKTDAN